jgi:hypothetical protein
VEEALQGVLSSQKEMLALFRSSIDKQLWITKQTALETLRAISAALEKK